MCEIHKARLLQPCSSGAPPTPMGPLHVAHVILEAPHLNCEVTRVSFVSIFAVKVAISSFAATSPV